MSRSDLLHQRAVKLLILAYILSTVNSFLTITSPEYQALLSSTQQSMNASMPVKAPHWMGLVLSVVFAIVLVWGVVRTKNWARVIIAAMFTFGAVAGIYSYTSVPGLIEYSKARPLSELTSVLSMTLQAVALYLLFVSEAKYKFRAKPVPDSTKPV